MACFTRISSSITFLRTQNVSPHSMIRSINGAKAVFFSSDASDGNQSKPETPRQESPTATADIAAAAASSTATPASAHAPATTRGPRRKKVGAAIHERKYFSPEFMPPLGKRSKLKDYLERKDCYTRRAVIDIPEFYPGSILAITVSDPYAPGKENRFVGICIERKNYGLGASFKLRNYIDEQGIEINYELYNPLIKKIEVLKLERRLDSHLLYLRDALPEYSAIDFDMVMIKHPPGKPVPVNDVKVKMKPKPWHKRWERFALKGIDMSEVLSEERIEEGKTKEAPEYRTMDLLNIFPNSSHSNQDRLKIRHEFDRHLQGLQKAKKKGSGTGS